MNKIIFMALIVSIMMVFTVGAALAAPGRPAEPGTGRPWNGQDGGNVKTAHAGVLGLDPEEMTGKIWGAVNSGRYFE